MTELDKAIADYERRLAEWKPKEELEQAIKVMRRAVELVGSTMPTPEPKKPRAKAQPKCTCGKPFSRHRDATDGLFFCPGLDGSTYLAEVKS